MADDVILNKAATIERWHNPRQRWRLEQQQQGAQLLTQLSVETG